MELWTDVHEALENFYGTRSDLPLIRSEIKHLRFTYRNSWSMGAPSFEGEHVQAAYSAAYFPSHAYAYLYVLLYRDLGRAIFNNTPTGARVVVLGSGVGAETVAVIRWMAETQNANLTNTSFLLADRADWSNAGANLLNPLLAKHLPKEQVTIDRALVDLATIEGQRFITSRIPEADVVLVPSLLTELISEHSADGFLDSLFKALSPGSKVVLMDHGYSDFERVSMNWSQQFQKKISQSNEKVPIPKPSRWARLNLLDGQNGRIPVRSYSMSWSVLER